MIRAARPRESPLSRKIAQARIPTPHDPTTNGPPRPAFWSLPARALRNAVASGYSLARLRADVLAGLVVGLVALPLSMALAIAVGVPPQYGLYTAIVAGCVIAVFGGSATQVSGPTAAFIVVLAPVVHDHGLGGLCVATLMAGAILVAMGLFRFGRLVGLVPHPVTRGFTLGIAAVIAAGQLPDFLGLSAPGLDPHPIPRLVGVIDRSTEIVPLDLGLGLVTLAVLLSAPRIVPRIPAPLLALLVVTLLGLALRWLWPGLDFATLGTRFSYVDASGATVPGIPGTLPQFALPWQLPAGTDGREATTAATGLLPDLALLRVLLPSALTIAVLGAIESLLSATVADGMTGARHDPDAELVGQGLGNMVAPFFGGFAATGAIARSATNVRAGATSPVAAIVHSGFVLVAMLALAPGLGHLPMAALAALLMLVAWNMSEIRHAVHVVRTAPGHDVGVLICCASLTVLFDMVIAVVAGVMLASLLFMRRMAEISGTRVIPSGDEELGGDVPDGVLVYEVVGPLFFGAAEKAMSAIHAIGSLVARRQVVIMKLHAVPAIDSTGLVNLGSAIARLRSHGIVVLLAAVQEQPRRAMGKAGLGEERGALEFFPSLRTALERARGLLEPVPAAVAQDTDQT